MPLIAASTVFIVAGISAIVQIGCAAAPLRPAEIVAQRVLQITERRSRLRRLCDEMQRPFTVGDQSGSKAAERALCRLVQSQGLKAFCRRFIRMIDRSDDLRLLRRVGLFVVDREHGFAEAAKKRTEPRHLAIRAR
jgi:hypothetical protein